MTNHPRRPQNNAGDSGRELLWGAGTALLLVLCCAGPALIASGVAAGALAVLGGWLASSWVIGLAGVATVLVVVGLVRRSRSGGVDDCCSPAAPTIDESTTPGQARGQDR